MQWHKYHLPGILLQPVTSRFADMKKSIISCLLALLPLVALHAKQSPSGKDFEQMQEQIKRSQASLDSAMKRVDSTMKANMRRYDSVNMQKNLNTLAQFVKEREAQQKRQLRIRLLTFGGMLLVVVSGIIYRVRTKRQGKSGGK
jgi:hypothetical protein